MSVALAALVRHGRVPCVELREPHEVALVDSRRRRRHRPGVHLVEASAGGSARREPHAEAVAGAARGRAQEGVPGLRRHVFVAAAPGSPRSRRWPASAGRPRPARADARPRVRPRRRPRPPPPPPPARRSGPRGRSGCPWSAGCPSRAQARARPETPARRGRRRVARTAGAGGARHRPGTPRGTARSRGGARSLRLTAASSRPAARASRARAARRPAGVPRRQPQARPFRPRPPRGPPSSG